TWEPDLRSRPPSPIRNGSRSIGKPVLAPMRRWSRLSPMPLGSREAGSRPGAEGSEFGHHGPSGESLPPAPEGSMTRGPATVRVGPLAHLGDPAHRRWRG